MYTIVENAKIVIALLKRHNIRHIVLSPGGSNIPIVQGVQDDPFFKCYSVVDERSAMYVAIGIYLQTGEMVATSCTSAQATRNYIPGLTEAYYKHVPILAITMSKHPVFVGQEYMQCPIQTSLPVDAVKKSYNLPYISTELDRQLCVRVANEAMLELTHHCNGPVQLNIEALDSETWEISDKEDLPIPRVIIRYEKWSDFENINLLDKRILIVVGEHRPFSDSERNAIENFCETNNVVVYTVHISNYHGRYSINGEKCLLCSSEKYFKEFLEPDIVITIGGITGDYVCYNKLSKSLSKEAEVWRVSPDGNVVDTYGRLTKIFEMRYEDFFVRFSNIDSPSHSFFEGWKNSLVDLDSIEIAFGNVFAAQQLHRLIPHGSNLNFAILNSFRSWLHFDLHPSIKCFCNVAAFGIDGCMSTMLGQSFCTDSLCFLITGDLSFYYDMNSLALRHIRDNVRILLVNNNGGAEFKLGNIHEKTDVSRYIAADNHFKNAKAWAEDNSFIYFSAHNKEEFLAHVNDFVGNSKGPVIFELFTTPDNDRKAVGDVAKACLKYTTKESLAIKAKSIIRDSIEGVFGEKVFRTLKNVRQK